MVNRVFSFSVQITTLIISQKPGNTGISRDIRTEFTTFGLSFDTFVPPVKPTAQIVTHRKLNTTPQTAAFSFSLWGDQDAAFSAPKTRNGNPGYRMLRVYLLREKISMSHTTILKYMQELGIRSTVTPKKPAYKKRDCYKKFEDHLNREFHAEKPNEKWCTDFTIFLWKMEESVIIAVSLTCMTDLWWQH